MRKLLLLAISCLLSLGMMGEGNTYRILSYNIRHGEGMDDRVDLERLARFICEEEPYVAAIQELDSCNERTQRDELNELAELTGMYPVFAPSISYRGGKYGVGMLSKEKPLSSYTLPLKDSTEDRVLLVVEFPEFVMACTHLSLHEEDRMKSFPILCEEAAKSKKPFFLAGDWNDVPQSPFIQKMLEKFIPCNDITIPTIPSDKPTDCIDFIALYHTGSQKVSVVERTSYSNTLFSDHNPISVAIRLSGSASSR